MLLSLQAAAKSAREDSPYFGVAEQARLERMLGALPEGDAGSRRVGILNALAVQKLQAGDVEEAIALHLEAARVGEHPGGGLPAAQAFQLGVAYLRMGEVENCAVMHNADRCLLPIRGEGVHERREGSTQAVRYLSEALEAPDVDLRTRLKSRWLLNLAHMTLGSYPRAVPKPHLIEPAAFESDEPFPRFLDVAPKLGLDEMSLSGGVVAEDFDRDGLLDLMVSSSEPFGQLRYYRNAADGSFVDQTERAGLIGIVGGLNLKQADYDNDGDADVLVLRGAWLRLQGRHPNSLLRNNGDGTFTDVAIAAGLTRRDYPTQTAAWADYDNDGDLDLFVGNENDPAERFPCELFRNDGDGSFTDVAAAAGVENLGYTKGAAWGDFDADGDPDLYVSNLGQPNRLYRNLGNGRFTDVAEELGVAGPKDSFSVWFWDFDNDGALDLYVSAYKYDLSEIVAGYVGLRPRVPLASLYRGDGRGGFRDVASRQNLTKVTMPMGSNYGDLDNDGFPDFYLGTGYPEFEGLMPNVMYRNRGGFGFADVTTAGGFGHLQKGHGIAFADLDNDGDQDVFAQMGGAFPGDAFMNALFENPGFENHWLKLDLVGTRSNRSGVGARIRLDVSTAGAERSIYTWVDTGSSFGSNPLRQEIGVGKALTIDRLEVFWPTSGDTQSFEKLDVDQAIEITEGRPGYRRVPVVAVPFAKRGMHRHMEAMDR